ncbi:hypothetical protein MLD38_018421 [Melastoma candidum]|uniref:Uncharacterized protein n=1 Tax=Melastoma candidum TaxID=119954 RepID=A0ACB9QTY6_9MYRT|nr:hypothetical protein MLD38_018421 [Melastoma candidum]
MEEKSGVITSGGVTVVGSNAPSEYRVAPRPENSAATEAAPAAVDTSPTHVDAGSPAGLPGGFPAKKKRGRPRKYGPDGSVTMALSPRPISSSVPVPPVIDFSAPKRGKVKLTTGTFDKTGFHVDNSGDWVASSVVGASFNPHIITVNAGEDVTMKIISFSQQGPRAICILSASGVISSVTLRQPDSSGGTLTYEGRFEILSLSGSFMPSESGGTKSRSGGMSVSLSSPDGRVVGGGVAGLLVAAGPVQVVVGSFLAGEQHEQKPKKPKNDLITTTTTTSLTAVVPISAAEPASFRGDSWSPLQNDLKNKPTDINVSLP